MTFRRSGSDGEIDVAHPTFFMPPAILAELGSKQAVLELWAYVESTLLSHAHLAGKDWHAFLATSAVQSLHTHAIGFPALPSWVSEDPAFNAEFVHARRRI